MADNLDITEGTGTTIATDQVGTDHYQKIKLCDGTADSSTVVAVDVGAKANALRVAPANDITDATYIGDIKFGEALPTGSNAIGKLAANTGVDIGDVDVTSIVPGTGATNLGKAEDAGHSSGDVGVAVMTVRQDTAAALSGTDADYQPLITDANGRLHVLDENTNAIKTAVEIMDDWDDSNYCNVNLNVAGTDVAANAGTLNAQTIRVTIATDDECNNFLGTIDADTGAIKTATELIDDAIYVDDADWSDGSSKHMLVGGLYQSSPQTVTDGDVAPIEVDVNGKVIESNSADIKTALEIIDDWDDSDYCNVNINIAGTDAAAGEGTISAQTQRVTIATDDDGVAHLATIAGDTTNIETAIQIIDDWDSTHDSAASADGPQVMAAYDSTKPTAVADGDTVRILADSYGRLLSGVEPQRFQAVYDSANATAEGEVVKASAASTIVVVQSYVISSDVEGWIKLQDEDSTALTGKFWLKAGGGVAITLPDKAPIVLTSNKDLEVIAEAAGDVSVSVTGYTIPG